MPFIEPNSEFGPYTPAVQPYEGPMYADTLAAQNLALVGEVSPIVRQRMRNEHGRYLAGLDGEDMTGAVGDDPTYQGREVYDLESEDDTYGSGIFDPSGRPGTANTNMGILASHYSLPGYHAREVPFTVSRDVTDITDGADVVGVPPGGMVLVEHHGQLQRPAILGPTWRPPMLENVGETTRDQVYGFMTRPGSPLPRPLHPNAPVVPPPNYRPARDNKYWQRPVPGVPSRCAVPRMPMERRVASTSTVNPADRGIAVSGFGYYGGMGVDPPPPAKPPATTGQMIFAGLILGAATGLVASLVRK